MALPEVLRNRDFDLFWSGVVLSQVGTRGALAANLYQVYDLTGSLLWTGLVGAAQAVAVLTLGPVGGAMADRVDRRRLLQVAQAASLVVVAGLSVLTLTGQVEAWQVVLSVLLTSAAATFDAPTRQALVPSLVPRHHLAQAFALVTPSREAAVLVGPALAGLLIAVGGPGLMYAVDAATYAGLIVVLARLRPVPPEPAGPETGPPWSLRSGIAEGARYVAGRPLVWRLMLLDVTAMVFGAYRVLVPAIALDRLGIGPAGYGLLAAAPSAGALVATYGIFRVATRRVRLGLVVIAATAAYGAAALVLAVAPVVWLALLAGGLLGATDAMATSIRQAVVHLDTPDRLRGRVSSIYQMSSRGSPAVGSLAMGAVAGLLGAGPALAAGGVVTVAVSLGHLASRNVVREYRVDRWPADGGAEEGSIV